ncbi:hypothetical protein BDD30_0375 [Photorhabdus asymbiotica]|uniref:Uncharacterized protein n=1 Tax=Photorhabdus asymbiotica TaxID=291112 RepID=A0ABX9SRK7_9GAMM|nr:hypothetical protein BDD30_0375 [Photorhabdus asymbiotica]
MNNPTPALIFEHSRYKLGVWKNIAPLDILAFLTRRAPILYLAEQT